MHGIVKSIFSVQYRELEKAEISLCRSTVKILAINSWAKSRTLTSSFKTYARYIKSFY